MPINFVTGLPRTGKTLFTIAMVKEIAEKQKRQVYSCNVPEVNIAGWLEIDHPDKWMQVPNSSIVIIDELQDFWGNAPTGQRVPLPILELSKHGKRGIDFYIITQEPDLVHKTPRSLCEFHYYVVRAFGTETAVVHKFSRMQAHPERIKKNFEKIIFRYPKEAFGIKDKDTGQYLVKPWYKSADVHNIKRKIPAKILAIPIVLAFAGLSIWGAVHFMGSTLGKAKGNGATASAAAVPGGPASVGPSRPAGKDTEPQTPAQYAASFQPRVNGLAYTAPRYDDLTKPQQVPYPAACLSMGKRCQCYSQQATRLDVPAQLCTQIAQGGFFMDWQASLASAQAGRSVKPDNGPVLPAAPGTTNLNL